MLGLFSRRAVDLVVLFMALYAFAFVPLGRRTGLEHLRAILRTHAASDAGRELVVAGDRLRRRLLEPSAEEPLKTHGHAVVPRLPSHGDPANAGLLPNAWRAAPDAGF